MSLYLEQIRQLVALQRVDDAIHSVEMELEQAPKELEDLKNRFEMCIRDRYLRILRDSLPSLRSGPLPDRM